MVVVVAVGLCCFGLWCVAVVAFAVVGGVVVVVIVSTMCLCLVWMVCGCCGCVMCVCLGFCDVMGAVVDSVRSAVLGVLVCVF